MSKLTFAGFVSADVTGDRSAFHTLRLEYVHAAIATALLGNATPMLEAAPHANGKTQKARAYKAGFSAVGEVSKFKVNGKPYAGKATDAIRQAIDDEAARLTEVFSTAFCEVFPLTPAELTEEQKASREAKRNATFARKAAEWASANGYAKPQDGTAPQPAAGETLNRETMGPAAFADAVILAVSTGFLPDDSCTAILRAINARLNPAPVAPAIPHDDAAGRAADASMVQAVLSGVLPDDSEALSPDAKRAIEAARKDSGRKGRKGREGREAAPAEATAPAA